MDAKAELRRAIKERLLRMTENDRRVESNVIVRELRTLIAEKKATVIAAYSPYVDEPDLSALITELLKEKNVICMGKMDGHTMTMHLISALDDVHRHPVTGLLQPKESAPLDEGTIDLVIVPGRAFTATGKRIGRGNGGYDRWIRAQRERSPRTTFVGVCFDCQLLTDLPTEPHDESMDAVVTASKVFRTA